jgi:hypothetical protein
MNKIDIIITVIIATLILSIPAWADWGYSDEDDTNTTKSTDYMVTGIFDNTTNMYVYGATQDNYFYDDQGKAYPVLNGVIYSDEDDNE